MKGMYGNGARSLRSFTSHFWILYNHDAGVLELKNHRGANNSEVGNGKGLRDGGEDSMKQLVGYIGSYSKALLRKMGVLLRSILVTKVYDEVKGLFGPNVGGKHDARGLVPAPMV